MGLFDQILGAINNPAQQGNVDQIGGILNTVQQVSNQQGINPSQTQSMMSILGGFVRSSLQQQAAGGYSNPTAIVNQYGSMQPNPQAVQAVFGAGQIPQVVQAMAQRTGLSPQIIQSLLPLLVPVVLNLLKSGATNSSMGGNPNMGNSNFGNPNMGNPNFGNAPMHQAGSNPVLNAFLDADHDGDVDISDALRVAGQYVNQPR
ncbi:DUF937 domain-containing protein [Leptolyngbya sp. ST-U4]|uniref:DUF937 domain-containing protein n=1 Tax=Leptolyngbya sp. ST-U4 TaxID=2933912 RepID=UPI0019BECF19|nr:DUF937 domain-containing protein [Cyanobacteria bacterium FACHB-502]